MNSLCTFQHAAPFLWGKLTELHRNPHNQTAITAVNAFSDDLAKRFSPIVGCTRSWDSSDPTDFQVGSLKIPCTSPCSTTRPTLGYHRQHDEPRGAYSLLKKPPTKPIDSPMQVFFQSEALTGNHTLREMAISHANKTMENHVRPDGTSSQLPRLLAAPLHSFSHSLDVSGSSYHVVV